MIYSRSGGTSVLPCTHPWAVRRRRWPPALACTGWLTSTDEGIVPLRVRDGSNEPGAPWEGASARSASPRRRARQDARNPCAVSTNPASDRPDWGPRAVLVRHAQRTDQLPARVVTVVRPAQGETAGARRPVLPADARRPVLPADAPRRCSTADAGRRCPWTLRDPTGSCVRPTRDASRHPGRRRGRSGSAPGTPRRPCRRRRSGDPTAKPGDRR